DDRRVRVHLVGRRGDRDVHAVGDLLDLEPCVAGALSLVTAAVRHRHSSFPDSPRGAHRRASAAAARLARPRSQTRLAAHSAEPPQPPLGSHHHVPRPAPRRASPSLRGRRSARTTTRGSGVSRAAILCDGGCALKGVLDSHTKKNMPIKLKLTIVQPETLTGADAPKNVDRAVAYIRQAAR